ncbi:Carboxypeptidase [Gryllus bimaculatus]|nr:Carboxypeptidase [Gryllus bimaculatus]
MNAGACPNKTHNTRRKLYTTEMGKGYSSQQPTVKIEELRYRLWRKTRSETQRCLLSDRYQGVDANRNFDFHWMEGKLQNHHERRKRWKKAINYEERLEKRGGKAIFNDFHIALLDDVQVDFWSKDDVMVSPSRQESFQRQLNEMDVAWKISIDNVQTVVQEEKESLQSESRSLSRDKFHSYQEMKDYLQELATLYSNTVSVGSIGSSYEGRDLPILKISSGGDDTRPIILIDAGIHAREWIAPAMALYIIQQLVENPSNADLIANVDWHVIPLLNPDGYEYSRKSVRQRFPQSSDNGGDGDRHLEGTALEGKTLLEHLQKIGEQF